MPTCPRCNQEQDRLTDTPPGAPWPRVCKPCGQFLWLQHDREAGLEIPAGMSKKRAQKSQPRYLPTERQKRIAQIARSIGANVNEDDVKKICEATRMELSMRK